MVPQANLIAGHRSRFVVLSVDRRQELRLILYLFMGVFLFVPAQALVGEFLDPQEFPAAPKARQLPDQTTSLRIEDLHPTQDVEKLQVCLIGGLFGCSYPLCLVPGSQCAGQSI